MPGRFFWHEWLYNLPKLLYTTTLDTVCCMCLGCIGMTPYTSIWGSFWTKKQCFSSTSPIPPESGGGQFSLHSAGSSELPDSFIVPKCSKILVMDFPAGYWNYTPVDQPDQQDPRWRWGYMSICLRSLRQRMPVEMQTHISDILCQGHRILGKPCHRQVDWCRGACVTHSQVWGFAKPSCASF